jgi:hypothetical protein
MLALDFSGSRQRIDVASLPAGNYILKLQSAHGVALHSFTKK